MQIAPRGEAPEKISVSRLPITGSDVFGREEDIAFLDRAWANKEVNVVTIVAWAGVGKSTLVNHWLRRMAAEKYRSAEMVFGWGFVLLPRAHRWPTLQITRVRRLFVVTWNTYPAMPVRSCSERLALRGVRQNCEVPAMSSAAIVWR